MVNIIIRESALKIEEVETFLKEDRAGGEVYFVGSVRNHTKGKEVISLEFECYEPMAISELKKIAAKAMQLWPLYKLAIFHRVGKLKVGEYPVIIGVSSAHRGTAFKACEFVIDSLKESVPIWKKEIFIDGEIWVSAHP